MTRTDSLTLSHHIMCGGIKAVGEPTVMDLLIANASTVIHFKLMKPIMKALNNM